MGADISSQDRFYRRGLVLGFTLAEIFVLIIFALLLALSSFLAAKDKEIEKLSQRLGEKEAAVAELTQKAEELRERFTRGDDFDDLFQELVQAKENVAEQERANTALREKNEALAKEKQALEERARTAGRLVEAAREAGVATGGPAKTVEEIAERLEQLEKVKDALKTAGLEDSQVAKAVEKTVERLRDTETRLGTLERQLQNLQGKLAGLGKGTEKPACWASRETGKSEYIFNTALTSDGIIVRDNALPHRTKEQAQLPLENMVFEAEVPPSRFLKMSRPVFEWSEKHACRFFVRVYDLTKDEAKMTYKRRLRTVGDRFYLYEVMDGTFRTLDEQR